MFFLASAGLPDGQAAEAPAPAFPPAMNAAEIHSRSRS